MFFRRLLTSVMAGVLVCGAASFALAQTAPPKSTKSAAAKPAAKQDVAKPPASMTGGAEPTLIGQFGTWGAYTATPNGKRVCFALAKPTTSKTNPPNRPRDPAYAFVSTRPAEKVSNEVSIMIGYTLKPGSESTLEVGGAAMQSTPRGAGFGSRTPPQGAKWARACGASRTPWSRAPRPRAPRRRIPSR